MTSTSRRRRLEARPYRNRCSCENNMAHRDRECRIEGTFHLEARARGGMICDAVGRISARYRTVT